MIICKFFGWLCISLIVISTSKAGEIGALPGKLANLGEEAKKVPEISELQNEFIKAWATDIADVYRPKMTALRGKYTGAIERLMSDAQKAGDLNAMLSYKKELEAVNKNKLVEPAESVEVDSSVTQKIVEMRKIYHDSAAEYQAEVAVIEKRLTGQFVESLSSLTAELTKQGKVEAAVTAKNVAISVTSVVRRENASTARSAPNTLIKGLDDISRLIPLGFDMTADGGLEKANQHFKDKVLDAPARWTIDVESVNDSPRYFNKREMRNLPAMLEIGGRNFDCNIRVYYDSDTMLDSQKNGDSIEVIGRIAACHVGALGGGKLHIDIANASANTHRAPNPSTIPLAPRITIISAVYGSSKKNDVRELVEKRMLESRYPIWASTESMKGDPDPGVAKSLRIRYKIDDEEKFISRGEGEKLVFNDLFQQGEE